MTSVYYTHPVDPVEHPVEPYSAYGASRGTQQDAYMGYQSPPQYHSSPFIESQYCSDFLCCGLQIPTMHELVTHYEEMHALTIAADGSVQPLYNPGLAADSASYASSPATAASIPPSSIDQALSQPIASHNNSPHYYSGNIYGTGVAQQYYNIANNNLYNNFPIQPQVDDMWYPAPPEYCIPAQFVSTTPSTLADAVPLSDIVGQRDRERSRERERQLEQEKSLVHTNEQPPLAVNALAGNVVFSATVNTGTGVHTPEDVFINTIPPLHPQGLPILSSLLNAETDLFYSSTLNDDADDSPADAEGDTAPSSPESQSQEASSPSTTMSIAPEEIHAKPTVGNTKAKKEKKDKKSRSITASGKRRKAPSAGRNLDPADKPYKCTTPGCIKTYLNANGLTYHQRKGTCEFEDDAKFKKAPMPPTPAPVAVEASA